MSEPRLGRNSASCRVVTGRGFRHGWSWAWFGLALASVSACQRAPSPEPAPARAERPLRTCAASSEARHEAPENAYAAYAEAINQARWCQAILVFDDASKPRVSVANFKSLALLAGTPNPKQRDYAAALKQFCARHRLECADDVWLARYVPAASSGEKAQAALASLTKLAETDPSTTYLELMEALQSVQPAGMAHLDPALLSIDNRGETATGLARRAGSKPNPVSFVRTQLGWKLTMPN